MPPCTKKVPSAKGERKIWPQFSGPPREVHEANFAGKKSEDTEKRLLTNALKAVYTKGYAYSATSPYITVPYMRMPDRTACNKAFA